MKPPRPPRRWVGWLLYPPAFLSLMLALAGGYMWGRSHFIVDRAGYSWQCRRDSPRIDRELYCWSAAGGVLVQLNETWDSMWTFRKQAFHATDGMMQYPTVAAVTPDVPHAYWDYWQFGYSWIEHPRERCWIEFDGNRPVYANRVINRSAVFPWWALLVVGLILPVIAFRRAVRADVHRIRLHRGLCLACGYDLRQSPERCPECGTPRADGPR